MSEPETFPKEKSDFWGIEHGLGRRGAMEWNGMKRELVSGIKHFINK